MGQATETRMGRESKKKYPLDRFSELDYSTAGRVSVPNRVSLLEMKYQTDSLISETLLFGIGIVLGTE